MSKKDLSACRERDFPLAYYVLDQSYDSKHNLAPTPPQYEPRTD